MEHDRALLDFKYTLHPIIMCACLSQDAENLLWEEMSDSRFSVNNTKDVFSKANANQRTHVALDSKVIPR